MTGEPERQIKILIGDKFSLYRNSLLTTFADKADIDILGEADSGVQLIEMLKHLSPDMIIADFTQKEINGFETLPHIKQNHPNIKLVTLALYEDPDIIIRILESGADSYILKNSSSTTLYESIKQCFANGVYLNHDTREAIASKDWKKFNKKKVRIGSKIIIFLKSIIPQN